MTSIQSSPISPASQGLSLDAFSRASRAGEAICVSASGQSLQVLGTGAMPDGRSVAWVAPDADTVSMFTQALAQTYGHGIASAVSRELGLAPSPGKPLASRVIQRALDMAQTSAQALEGVNFITRLDCSASVGGPVFVSVCKELGIAPGSVTAGQRQGIDQAMQQKFDQAAQSGQTPVAPEAARAWLRGLLGAR